MEQRASKSPVGGSLLDALRAGIMFRLFVVSLLLGTANFVTVLLLPAGRGEAMPFLALAFPLFSALGLLAMLAGAPVALLGNLLCAAASIGFAETFARGLSALPSFWIAFIPFFAALVAGSRSGLFWLLAEWVFYAFVVHRAQASPAALAGLPEAYRQNFPFSFLNLALVSAFFLAIAVLVMRHIALLLARSASRERSLEAARREAAEAKEAAEAARARAEEARAEALAAAREEAAAREREALAKEEAAGSAQLFQSLLDTLPIPVFYKTLPDLRNSGCNQAFLDYTGLAKADFLGRTVQETFSPRTAALHEGIDAALLAGGGSRRYESVARDASGLKRRIILSKAVFNDGRGSPAGIVGAFLDIEENRRLEEGLRAALRTKDSLISLISHDIVNPLWAFRQILELADLGYVEAAEMPAVFANLRSSSDYLLATLENLLSWAKSGGDGLVLKPSSLDLGEVAAEEIGALAGAAGLRNVRIQRSPPDAFPAVVDLQVARCVLRNLLGNAVKYGLEGSLVRLELGRAGGALSIAVENLGARFDEAAVTAILRAGGGEEGPAREGTGVGNFMRHGLGLVLVRDFARMAGGSARCESREEGVGKIRVRFTVELPEPAAS